MLSTQDNPLAEKPRLDWMCGSATFTMVVSSTTMSCAVRITKRTRAGFWSWRRRFPGRPPGRVATDGGCGIWGRLEGIDESLSGGSLEKRKLPPVSIRRVPPVSKGVGEKGMTDVARQDLEVNAPTPAELEEPAGSGRPMRADARRNYDRLVVAAREVFAQEGGGASMEAIARRAG